MTYSINERYIIATIKGAPLEELVAMKAEAAKELIAIKGAKSDVFKRFLGVHGRFQQSQLDVLDIRETKMCAIFDNLSDMICLAAA